MQKFFLAVLAVAVVAFGQQASVQQNVNMLISQQANIITMLTQLPAVVAQRDSLAAVVQQRDREIAELKKGKDKK